MPLPVHPALAPGAVVVRRDDAWLEVRLGQHRVVVLPDRPEVREVLDHLREHRRPLAWVLLGLGGLACVMAWQGLGAKA